MNAIRTRATRRAPEDTDVIHLPERRVREDALPESLDYHDTGCELAPRCLDCPLPRCRYDQPGGARRLLTESRDTEIARRRATERIPINALARQYGLSRRSVFRILRKVNGRS